MTRLLFAFLILTISSRAAAQDRLIRIPVVVHVVYSDSLADNGVGDVVIANGNSTMYLPKAKIESEIADLHNDFLLLNSDTSKVIADFKNVVGNPRVEFFLSDIKYVRATRRAINSPLSNSERLIELSPIVDSKRHLNVYLKQYSFTGPWH